MVPAAAPPPAKPVFKAPPPTPKPVAPPLWLSGKLPTSHKHNSNRDTVYNRDYGGGRGGGGQGKNLPVSRESNKRECIREFCFLFFRAVRKLYKKLDIFFEKVGKKSL